jgi:hypothetical protein
MLNGVGVKEPNGAHRTEEASEVVKADKTPCTDELSEGAYAANKDFAAHDLKESGAVHLTRNTATDTPMTDAVGKLPTDTDGNKKDKLDYGIDSRSMRVIEDKDEGTAKVHCLVAKNMSPDLDDCSVSHCRLDRLTCAWHVGQDSRARDAADANRRQRHQASLSAHARTARSLTDR